MSITYIKNSTLAIIIILMFSCSKENEIKTINNKTSDSMNIEKIDSLLTQKVDSPDSTIIIADSLNPETKILPKTNYIKASAEMLKWAKSSNIEKALKNEVKKPEQITNFLEKYINSIVKKYDFVNRVQYLNNENFYINDKDVRKISDEIQLALDLKITPYIADSLLDENQKKDKSILMNKLELALNILKSEKYKNKIKEIIKRNSSDVSEFDRINEEIFTEAGFKNYQEAMNQINNFRHDPDIQGYLLELNRVGKELTSNKK